MIRRVCKDKLETLPIHTKPSNYSQWRLGLGQVVVNFLFFILRNIYIYIYICGLFINKKMASSIYIIIYMAPNTNNTIQSFHVHGRVTARAYVPYWMSLPCFLQVEETNETTSRSLANMLIYYIDTTCCMHHILHACMIIHIHRRRFSI